MIHTIDDLIHKISTYESGMDLNRVPSWPSLRFSNTGRRGEKKEFEISLFSLEKTLIDIKNNFSEFEVISNYIEKQWRDAFSNYLTDPVVNALSTVQTLPLYSVVHKVLCAVNNIAYVEKQMPLTETYLNNTIAFLNRQVHNYTASISFHEITTEIDSKGTGENIIYYGAPGTGKSFAIDQKTGPHNSIRTVFHPETQYSDFVGCIKPSMGDDGIEYSFRKGPFTEVLIRAMNDPEQHYYLIIEEINRAPAAAVFGELFQLLDRNADGRSSYTIDINDKDLLQIFNTELSGKFPDNKLFIPSNLSIYATMNSSDQAVMPLDTAFKRRWKFNYIPINFSNSPEGSFEIIAMDEEHRISWSDFAQSVNRILSAEAIPEDRHLGPWFVTAEEIASPESSDKTLTGKVLMYLWDDVLRHTERTVLFHPDIRTFGSLVEHYSRKAVIFSDRFQNQLQEKLIAVLPGETEGITGE